MSWHFVSAFGARLVRKLVTTLSIALTRVLLFRRLKVHWSDFRWTVELIVRVLMNDLDYMFDFLRSCVWRNDVNIYAVFVCYYWCPCLDDVDLYVVLVLRFRGPLGWNVVVVDVLHWALLALFCRHVVLCLMFILCVVDCWITGNCWYVYRKRCRWTRRLVARTTLCCTFLECTDGLRTLLTWHCCRCCTVRRVLIYGCSWFLPLLCCWLWGTRLPGYFCWRRQVCPVLVSLTLGNYSFGWHSLLVLLRFGRLIKVVWWWDH